MSLLFETLLIDNGVVCHLEYHQQRFDNTRKALFGSSSLLLSPFLTPPQVGIFRCRIVYHETIESITYTPYVKHPISHLTLREQTFSYPYKYQDRPFPPSVNTHHDILYHTQGIITDTTICNVAFFDGKQWVTPQHFILEGTTRARLIKEGFLIPKMITLNDLNSFMSVAIMNALRGFEILGKPSDIIL